MKNFAAYYAGAYTYSYTNKWFHPWFPSYNPQYEKYYSENVNLNEWEGVTGQPAKSWPDHLRSVRDLRRVPIRLTQTPPISSDGALSA